MTAIRNTCSVVKSTINDFRQFIKKPTDEQITLSFAEKLKVLAVFLLIELIVILPLYYLIEALVNVCITIEQPPTYLGLIELLITLILVAPIVEELLFRLVLRYRNFFNKFRLSRERWNKFFPFLVYIVTIIFGLSHAVNFDNNSLTFFLLLPLITLPQLVLGFMIAFLRVRFNLFWGLALHILWNILAVSLSILIFLPTQNHTVTTDTYSLESHSLLSYSWDVDTHFSAKVGDDGKLKQLSAEQYPITEVLEGLTEKDFIGKDELVNIEFESKDGIAIAEFVDVMLQKYEVKEQGEKPLEELIINTDDYSLTLYERGYVDVDNKMEVEYIKTPNGKLLMKLTAKSVSLKSVMDDGMGGEYISRNSYDEDKLVDVDFESKDGVSMEEFTKLIQSKFDIEKY